MALATGCLSAAVTNSVQRDVVLHESKDVHDYGHRVLELNAHVSKGVRLHRVHGSANRGSHDLSKVVPWHHCLGTRYLESYRI